MSRPALAGSYGPVKGSLRRAYNGLGDRTRPGKGNDRPKDLTEAHRRAGWDSEATDQPSIGPRCRFRERDQVKPG